MSRYRVVSPYQVHHDGVTYGPGETFEATPGAIDPWVAAGWVESADDKPAKRATRRQAG